MKRGPPPTKGFDLALPIALVRGRVMLFQPLPDHVCDFTITGNGIFALVRLMTATRLHVPIEEIAREFSGAIAGLATIPFGGPVSRELWLYSRYGTMRFFRITGTGLEEIDCCGFLFVNGKPVITLPSFPGTISLQPGPTIHASGDSAPKNPAAPAATGPSCSDPYDPKSPIIRWLKKKNAEKKREPGVNDSIGSINPVVKKDPAHKQLSALKKQVTAIETVILVKEPVAESPANSSYNESSAGRPDHLPSPGKTEEEI